MKLGYCGNPAVLSAFSEIPFDYLEANVQSFLVPEKEDVEFAPLLESARNSTVPVLAANCFIPGDLKVVGPVVDHARLLRYADTAFRRAAQIDLSLIVFGSGGARQSPEGWSLATAFEQYVESLQKLAPVAERHGVTLLVEPLNRGECNVVNTVLEGALAVARAGHPNIRLLVDIFHMLRNGECADDIVKVGPYVAHAHIAENQDRTQPGFHGENLGPYLKALQACGYAGNLTIECIWNGVPAEAAKPAFDALRLQLKAAGFEA